MLKTTYPSEDLRHTESNPAGPPNMKTSLVAVLLAAHFAGNYFELFRGLKK